MCYSVLNTSVVAECLAYTNHKHVAHHALGTAIGTVLSQTGDWFGGRSKRQKENVDSSASGSNSAAEAGSNSEVGYFEDGNNSAVEIGNNTNLFDSS